MPTKSKQRSVNDGKWTEARFRSFIVSALRQAHGRWGPKNEAKRLARISRGVYRCAECGNAGPATLAALPGRKRRRNNAAVDHIKPVVDPNVGFVNWETYISRMFVEAEGYQVLCWACHEAKTAEERRLSTVRRKGETDKN